MDIFGTMAGMGHEQVAFCNDEATGLKTIIAVHDTTLGPGLGGLRMWPYASEQEALTDVLRLSRGMTYKNAAAGLNLGGAKAVIIGDPSIKSEALYRAFGRFVDSLGGRYITAEDVNTSTEDIMTIREETRHVSGTPESVGGAGNPSPYTAIGVHAGILAAVKAKLGRDNLKGVSVAVQGLGAVGSALCALLAADGAVLTVADVDLPRVRRMVADFGATAATVEGIFSAPVDVFSPCALGAVINDQTLPQFKCQVIAGGANNQLLEEDRHGEELRRRGILYAPDYIVNAGGVINVYYEVINEYRREAVVAKVKAIHATLETIFKMAEGEGVSTHIAAARFAEARIRAIGGLRFRNPR